MGLAEVGRMLQASALKGIIRGYVVTFSKQASFAQVREAFADGFTPLQNERARDFILAAARANPKLLDEISFTLFIQWVREANPQLAGQVIADTEMMRWGRESWDRGIAAIRAEVMEAAGRG